MSPKTFRRNDDNLSVLIPGDLKRKIKALSFVWGDDGRISHTTRRILMSYMEAMEKDWAVNEPVKLAEFNAVLENLYKAEKIEADELAEKLEMKELAE